MGFCARRVQRAIATLEEFSLIKRDWVGSIRLVTPKIVSPRPLSAERACFSFSHPQPLELVYCM